MPVPRKSSGSGTRPNQVWSWDLTELGAAEKWTYYHLHVLLDSCGVPRTIAPLPSFERLNLVVVRTFEGESFFPPTVQHIGKGPNRRFEKNQIRT